jgi:PAS domain S-box-containing protein
MINLVQRLFSPGGSLPQRDGYHWVSAIVWLKIDADALVVVTCYWITITLVYIARKRGDLPFGRVLVCFALFFCASGTMHLLDLLSAWHSNAWFSGTARAAMALASAPAAILLARLAPKALALPSPTALKWLNAELEQEIANRRQAEEHAQKLNAELEERVAQRTAELIAGNREQMRQIAQRKLADERFRLVVEASPNAIVLANATGRILLVNSSAEDLFGFNREELMGKPFATLLPERFRAAYGDGTASIPHPWGRSAAGGDLFALRKDGSETPIEIGRSPIETAEGALVLSTIVDISQRRQAEEALLASELDFRASFYSSAVGQAQVAPISGRYLRVNPKFCEIAGYSEEELLQMTFHDLTHPEDRENDSEAHERMVRGEASEVNREKRYLRKDGRAVWIQINASVIRDLTGRPMRTLAIIVDISERKRAEEEVQKLNADLDQRVNERTAQLEAANKELEAFSYSVSHDLRAPLRAVDGFSQAVLEDYASQLPEDCGRYLRRIRAGAQKMGNLIDDLLTLSRLSRAPLNKREVDTSILVRGVLDDLQSQPNAKQTEVRFGDLPCCQGDPALLKQVWINLLSNALKYTLKKESPVVEIGCTRQSEGNVYFVRDNGTGFDMRYANKLFGVFQRLHRAEDYEGTGVGLAIVQRIIHRHGGHVWAEAEVNRGAAFYFTLEEFPQS